MLNEEELKDAALLVFANKQDQPGAKGAGEISEALRLGELRDRNWSIMACSAVDGSGINEGMDWLVVSEFAVSVLRHYLTLTANACDSKLFRKSSHSMTHWSHITPFLILICNNNDVMTLRNPNNFAASVRQH